MRSPADDNIHGFGVGFGQHFEEGCAAIAPMQPTALSHGSFDKVVILTGLR